jgi:SAM-dependent methyltransferase
MPDNGVFALPREIKDTSDCYFYHKMEVPGFGVVGGEWDLRGGEEQYLGGVSFSGKRVLELGTASGFLCRYMEKHGAEVVGFDLPDDSSWDFIPFSQIDLSSLKSEATNHIQKLKNGWWLCHRVFSSQAKVVYGSIYNIPRTIGSFDIATFGSILLHLRDPFLALQNALRLTKETVVVTDLVPQQSFSGNNNTVTNRMKMLLRRMKDPFRSTSSKSGSTNDQPVMRFAPNFRNDNPHQCFTWWYLSPEIIVEFLGILGFEKTTVSYHTQKFQAGELPLYTVVGTRTQKMSTT